MHARSRGEGKPRTGAAANEVTTEGPTPRRRRVPERAEPAARGNAGGRTKWRKAIRGQNSLVGTYRSSILPQREGMGDEDDIIFFRSMKEQMLRFATVGVSNTAVDFCIYLILTRVWAFWETHYLLANALAFTTAVAWSFYWNERWTFRPTVKRRHVHALRFFCVSIVALLLTQGTLALGVRVFGLLDVIAKIGAVGISIFWSFTAHRLWTFS